MFLAPVSFHDNPKLFKARPVIVVSSERATHLDVVAVSVSSQRTRSEFDVIIEFWREAGLSNPSIARTSKLFTVESDQLLKRLGKLMPSDLTRVTQKCHHVFQEEEELWGELAARRERDQALAQRNRAVDQLRNDGHSIESIEKLLGITREEVTAILAR